MNKRDLLIEIGTEELPPKALRNLSLAFRDEVAGGLRDAALAFDGIEPFATPRRLALIVGKLQEQQEDIAIEKFGPAVQAAFDEHGKPTRAAEGFAKSCGVAVEALGQQSDGKALKLFYRANKPGRPAVEMIPDIVIQALARLPVPKRMRWGSSRVEFVRPVHWTVLLFGGETIPATILGVATAPRTYGHRFHHPAPIELSDPGDYAEKLAGEGRVLPSFDARREKIRTLVMEEGRKLGAEAIIEEDLLEEVTALVEWPVPLAGRFDESYLQVPKEALISSLKEHQKCFYLLDADGNILPNFITVSNIVSEDPAQVIAGNERVIGPRLADAAFFYDQDKKQPLADRRDNLKRVIFQQDLGTLYDKSKRVRALTGYLAPAVDADPQSCARAAELGKCDLLTYMVGEFADLQGIMGYYYALHDGEPEAVALALREQYLPRYAGDELPSSETGTVLALAERLDTLCGLFGIGQPPTGSKDPFALRRATLGILRIIIEKNLDLDLAECVREAADGFSALPEREGLEQRVLDFIFERLRARYADLGIGANVFLAVDAVRPTRPLEFDLRVKAVDNFARLPDADALAAANKRVANILEESDINPAQAPEVDSDLLTEKEEKQLATLIETISKKVAPLLKQRDFTAALEIMASLRTSVDAFFDTVMVNTDDDNLRRNRHALLGQLRQLFLQVADISRLQKG